MAAKFVVYFDKSKKFRFRLLAGNNEIIAVGEAYESRAACLKGIQSIKKNAPVAPVVDETLPKEPKKGKPAAEKKPTDKKPVAKKPAAKKPAAKKPEDPKPETKAD